METIIMPQVVETNQSKNSATFRISPLFPGYGHTIGNSLRRVLLSSLPGAAVTSVKIDGVNHEFSTVPGIKEDVVEIILNLKGLRVLMHDTAEPVILKLSVKKDGVAKAKDFLANSKITIANPEMHIATLSSKAELNLEVTVEYGRGYNPIEKRETKSLPLGTIAIDSLFSPVQAVSIEVENTRVGKMTNYDELHLLVTTDGTISPKDAVKMASAILVDQYNVIAHFDEHTAKSESSVIEENTTNSGVSELALAGLPVRIVKILSDNGVVTMETLVNLSDEQLKNVTGLGPKAIGEIMKIRQTK